MPTIDEVKRLALELPETDRANLVADLLQSLPAVLHGDAAGIAEALGRDAELDANPERGISLEELRRRVRGHSRRSQTH